MSIETLTSQEESFSSEVAVRDGMDRLAPSIQAIEDWYEAEFKNRMAKLPELLRIQVGEEMRSQLNADFQATVEIVRHEHEERLHLKVMQWNSERESLKAESEDFRHASEERLEAASMQWSSERESLKTEIEDFRHASEERFEAASMQWRSERESLKTEIEALQNIDELLHETTKTESAIEEFGLELTRMINDPVADVSILMRTKVKQSELTAYLKGLRFQVKK